MHYSEGIYNGREMHYENVKQNGMERKRERERERRIKTWRAK